MRNAHVRGAFSRVGRAAEAGVCWFLFARWDQRPFVAYVLRDARVEVIER